MLSLTISDSFWPNFITSVVSILTHTGIGWPAEKWLPLFLCSAQLSREDTLTLWALLQDHTRCFGVLSWCWLTIFEHCIYPCTRCTHVLGEQEGICFMEETEERLSIKCRALKTRVWIRNEKKHEARVWLHYWESNSKSSTTSSGLSLLPKSTGKIGCRRRFEQIVSILTVKMRKCCSSSLFSEFGCVIFIKMTKFENKHAQDMNVSPLNTFPGQANKWEVIYKVNATECVIKY